MTTTILIVDDHSGFRRWSRTLLELDGFEVVGEAADGRSGLAAARALNPDLVLLDVRLPDISGFDVADALARDEQPPVVVLTSSRDASEYGSRVHSNGASGFLPKRRLSGAALAAFVGSST